MDSHLKGPVLAAHSSIAHPIQTAINPSNHGPIHQQIIYLHACVFPAHQAFEVSQR